MNGLYTVVGVYADQTRSAPLAKYSDLKRAIDAAHLVNQLAQVQRPSIRTEPWGEFDDRSGHGPPPDCGDWAMAFFLVSQTSWTRHAAGPGSG